MTKRNRVIVVAIFIALICIVLALGHGTPLAGDLDSRVVTLEYQVVRLTHQVQRLVDRVERLESDVRTLQSEMRSR